MQLLTSLRARLGLVVSLGVAALTSAGPARAESPDAAERPPAAARPRGNHCLNEPGAKVLLSQSLIALTNPLGTEHTLQLSLCIPLIRQPGVLFDLTNVEFGLENYLSPTYVIQGGFVSVTPLSFLQLRAGVAGVYVWKLPVLPGTGYYALPTADSDHSEDAAAKLEPAEAGGYLFTFGGTLRGRLPLSERFALLLFDSPFIERWSVGDGPYYVNPRRDIVVSTSDLLLVNTVGLFGEIVAANDVTALVGVTDFAAVEPRSGRLNNLASLAASLKVVRPGSVLRIVQPFVQAGLHTHHSSVSRFRQGEVSLLGGIYAGYELAPLDI